MKNIFKKINKLLKAGFRFAYLNIRYIKKNFKIKEGKYAILNFDHQLKSEDHSRYFYIICMFLKYAGFNVIIKTQWRDFRTFKKPLDFKKLLLQQNYILVRESSAPLNTIVLVQPGTPNHTVRLSYGYHLAYEYKDIIKSGQVDCIAPYPAYPMQYKYYSNPSFLPALRKSNRTMKMFFAGDTSEIRYANAKVEKCFKVLPRLEVIKYILSNFKNSKKLQGDSGKLILKQLLSLNDYINEIIISQVKTQEEDWLKILSKTDFFICTPGERMPWSHNCVEAMSVGAIPILEYGDLLYPALENSKNCLSFTDREGLQKAIERALAMEPSEIQDMRQNVLDYYDKNLSADSILNKIKTFSKSSRHELKVAFPFVANRKEWLSIQAVYDPKELEQLRVI